jgi:hypothetical protein
LVVLNLDQARFECTFGRGCDGICCRNGRPPIYPEESERIDGRLDRILPELRPEARAVVEIEGYTSRRRKVGQPTARIVGGWCVFFNQGCVLHRIGAAEGDAFRYKPFVCAVFPLAPVTNDHWYVRQKGYRGEIWDLFCLDPAQSAPPAARELAGELRLVQETVL